MPEIVLFDSDYITVKYLSEKNLIYHTVHKPIGDSEIELLKDALNAGTDALKRYQSKKWLSDDRQNGPLPSDVVEWGNTDWNPRTIQAGWKYWANVVPKDVHAAGTLMPVIESLHKHGLQMRVFTDLESAFRWLDSL